MRKRLLALVFVVGALAVGPATAASATTSATTSTTAVTVVSTVSPPGYVQLGRYWS